MSKGRIKRLDAVEVAATDRDSTASVYRHNFALTPARNGEAVQFQIGAVTIRLVPSQPWSSTSPQGSSMPDELAALWLEADDLEQLVRHLDGAGISHEPIRRENGRRVLFLHGPATNFVRLAVFDHA